MKKPKSKPTIRSLMHDMYHKRRKCVKKGIDPDTIPIPKRLVKLRER